MLIFKVCRTGKHGTLITHNFPYISFPRCVYTWANIVKYVVTVTLDVYQAMLSRWFTCVRVQVGTKAGMLNNDLKLNHIQFTWYVIPYFSKLHLLQLLWQIKLIFAIICRQDFVQDRCWSKQNTLNYSLRLRTFLHCVRTDMFKIIFYNKNTLL